MFPLLALSSFFFKTISACLACCVTAGARRSCREWEGGILRVYVFQKVVPKVVCYKFEKLDQAETAYSICRVILAHLFLNIL